jgi:hypothetical protein
MAATCALIVGCASLQSAQRDNVAYVVLGEDGAAMVRVLTPESSCPAITVDARELPMAVRVPLSVIPQRGHPESSPSPILTCELPIPAGTRHAFVAGHALPLPQASYEKIVVIGDTGCRMGYQKCQPESYPFEKVAASAARFKPDLVVHVGDYHYREGCPSGMKCDEGPWGYGWDAWNADFFTPGRVLLEAAPWVTARGNHESCSRAGQGYWRFLDPRPLMPGHDCNEAKNDGLGDHSEPYAVPLGAGAQLIVFDTSNSDRNYFKPGDPRIAIYSDTWRRIDELAHKASYNIGVDHHPLFALGAYRNQNGEIKLFGTDKGLEQSFGEKDRPLLPPSISMLLSGHIHLWEQVSFKDKYPTQFVSGFSGTDEDVTPLPSSVPPDVTPAPSAVIKSMSSWVGGFGFMTMERRGADEWLVKVWDRDGHERNSCQAKGTNSSCAVAQVK